jgi:putative Mg2+ transporter-C (MgtC) family protein
MRLIMEANAAQLLVSLQALRWDMAGQIALAALLGGIIGFERDWYGHAAGLRTNILVAVGSCLFTILSITGFPLQGAAQDTARIAAQIVSGIGFIGAGVLLRGENRVRGLTTAATIWQVAAIGMAVGVGFYFLAVFTTLFTIAVLVLLRPIGTWLEQRSRGKPTGSDEEW